MIIKHDSSPHDTNEAHKITLAVFSTALTYISVNQRTSIYLEQTDD